MQIVHAITPPIRIESVFSNRLWNPPLKNNIPVAISAKAKLMAVEPVESAYLPAVLFPAISAPMSEETQSVIYVNNCILSSLIFSLLIINATMEANKIALKTDAPKPIPILADKV